MAEPERLSARDFAAFYRHVHGVDPFPWQSDLVERVLDDERWPDLVDVPTGLGKTSMIDVAVFVAAAAGPRVDGPGRRRCFLVVDRRLVVDEAHTHACRVSEAVGRARASDGVVGRVAAGLRAFSPAAGELLPVTRMRGGTTWDAAWLDRPDRPGIVLGTVDQVGSRLLFRGYGVGDRRRSLDAALVGTDSLVLVDEAHLATALITTVDAALARDHSSLPVPPMAVVRLSATGAPSERTYALDEDAHRDHAEAWRRLTAGKRLTGRTATVKSSVRALADTVVEHLDALVPGEPADNGGAPVGLVVCNTVDRAREVHAELGRRHPAVDRELLIGRSRPVDRVDSQERIVELFGIARRPTATGAVLVATQTVEVGVNLDVDVLVTESASWDALVQRLGRLNRLGRFASRFSDRDAAPAVVVHDGQAEGPIYGTARDHTWSALVELDGGAVAEGGPGLDVSPSRCRHLSATTMADPRFRLRPSEVPVLLAPILDAWVQTGPVPLNDPPVAPYLHGFESGTAPVQILWREGLLAGAGDAGGGVVDPFDDVDEDAERAAPQLEMLLAQWPPRAEETVEVPFGAARRWLAGDNPGAVGDVDGAPEHDAPARSTASPIRVLVQRTSQRAESSAGDDSALRWVWIDALALRPGDRVVVPSEHGGHDRHGWAPLDRAPVPDVREALAFALSRSRREPALGLDRGLLGRLGVDADDDLRTDLAALLDLSRPVEEPDELRRVTSAIADRLPEAPPAGRGWSTEAWRVLRLWLDEGNLRPVDITDPADAWFPGSDPRPWRRLLAGPLPAAGGGRAVAEGDDDEVAASSVSSGPVTLTVHHEAVGSRAREIATALGLDDLVDVCADAARWHDLGKVDDRFQAMLHGGDAVDAALAVEPLAKSGMDASDRAAWRRAARLSGLPPGARHEAWSAALVEEHLAHHAHPGDADLLIHLVASHHGHARPWSRLVVDSAPRELAAVVDGHETVVSSARTVALDHPGRFVRLNQRYGRWGLALLEAVVRCADTTVSGEGS